jgi:DDE superfamily endonuclease
LSWRLTIIPTGVISNWPSTSAALIESSVSGAAAGAKPNRSMMLPGRAHRGVFPPELRAQVTATACSLPRTHNLPLARWSRAELARRVAAACPLSAVSPSTVGRWLKQEKIRPWRYRMWQHIHDGATFLERARPILRLYASARPLLLAGTWVVCVDEKTSIQARQAEQTPRPASGRYCARQSPRYKRRGARHLIAGLSVADGQVIGQCSRRKRFVDFQSFIQTVVVPQAQRRGVQTVALILDNGPTHAPKQLERWLREQEAAQSWGLTFQLYWLPKKASWLDQIEIWFSILQRKLLEPNHFASTEALEQAIHDFIAYYNQMAKPINWTYTVEQLERKLGSLL